MTLRQLAWRNLWRNKRRSLLTIGAIAFATFLTAASRGLAIGTWEFSLENSITLFSGFLQVEEEGYQDNPSLKKSLPFPGTVDSVLRSTPGLTGYAPRILADGLVSFRRNSAGAAILGVDPRAEQRVSRFNERVRKGRMVDPEALDEIVVGEKLLENLSAAVGDSLVILAQGYDGVMGNLRFRVVGALKMGVPEFDASSVIMPVRAAQELLAMDGRVSVIAIGAPGLADLGGLRERLHENLRAAGASRVETLTWDEVMPELEQAMEVDLTYDAFFLLIVVVIVAFGILNTILMSVTERFREFGISLAMGMKPAILVRLVLIETVFLGVLGVVAGGVLAQATNWYLSAHPIMLGGNLAQFYEDFGFVPQIVSTTRWSILFEVMGSVLIISSLAGVYPAVRAGRLEPLKGIRTT